MMAHGDAGSGIAGSVAIGGKGPLMSTRASIRSSIGPLGIVLSLLGCTLVSTATPSPSPAHVGGTLRVVLPGDQEPWGRFTTPRGDDFPDGDPATLDPHLDAYSPYDTWELYRCCLTRTLLSNNGRSTADGGARIHPDVAEALPEISADGLTWTFKLKQGLRYAPPMQDVEIRAQDFVRSFHRVMAPRFAEQSYARAIYSDIVGAEAYLNGEATSISGLESSDEHTLVIRLVKPAGDFGPRIALPIVPPVPPSPTNPTAPFGVAEGHDDGYGRFLVASGPYMVEGSADLDFSVPPEQRTPVAGLVPGQRIALVENPSWDPAFDELRLARPTRIELEIVPTLAEASQ
jgi:peptide/nickel transport system substrate-binding protein